MQKIFYNAKCLTLSDSLERAEAFFCNDEAFVLVGSNKEILDMKNDDSSVFDLGGKMVMPTFFDTDAHVFEAIEQKLKNANLDDFIEKMHADDENYEKFDNFDVYLKEFLVIQEAYLKNGITTICEMNIDSRSFAFWKKLSEQGNLKIDVVGYVNILTSKDVMDNNCRSYRKYKNHFRLGGYMIALDGKIIEKRAWMKKPYKHEKGYAGYSSVFDEQLRFVIKTAIEEKKQLIVETNGDKSLDQFLRVAEDVFEEKKDADKFLPVAKNCNSLSKEQMQKLKKLGIGVNFELDAIKENSKLLKDVFGFRKLREFLPAKYAIESGIEVMFHSDKFEVKDNFDFVNFLFKRMTKQNKIIGEKHKISPQKAIEAMTKTPAKFCFDGEQKGSLESGKHADFIVLSGDIDEDLSKVKVEKVFVDAELVYDSTAK
jgi:hypothetical protein